MFVLVLETDELGIRFFLKSLNSSFEVNGTISDIATESATMRIFEQKEEFILLSEINDIPEAIEWIRDVIISRGYISSVNDIKAIAQYVMHGGDRFKIPTLLTEDTLVELDKWKDYAPVTMEINLSSIIAARKLFPNIPQFGVFDTAFYHTIPEYAKLYALPYDYIRKHKIKRYGFHGILHRYMMNRAYELTGIKKSKSRLITIEIGYGCSVTAIRNGVAVETSMGFSRLEGPFMLERSGSVNFDVLSFLHTRENMSFEEINTMLYRFSGLCGLAGGLHSLEEVLSAIEKGDKVALNAYRAFVHGIRKHIGAKLLILSGVDVIVVSGALAEKSPKLREDLFEDLTFFGIVVDSGINQKIDGSNDAVISAASSSVKVLYVKRNSGKAIFEEVEKFL